MKKKQYTVPRIVVIGLKTKAQLLTESKKIPIDNSGDVTDPGKVYAPELGDQWDEEEW